MKKGRWNVPFHYELRFTDSGITFDQAWKAAGFSSNMDDYFDVEVAKFVGMK